MADTEKKNNHINGRVIHKKDEYVYAIIYRRAVIKFDSEPSVTYIKTPIINKDSYGHWAETTIPFWLDKKIYSRYIKDKNMNKWNYTTDGWNYFSTKEENFEEAKKQLSRMIANDYEYIKHMYETTRRLLTTLGTIELEYQVNENFFDDDEDD